MTTTSTTDITMASTDSHTGTAASSPERRRYTKYATITMNSSTMAMSSWVMPLVKWPKPLKMRSQCSRWKNTAMPPTARSTTDMMRAGIWARLPSPRSRYSA